MQCIKKLFLQVVIVVAFASIHSGTANATLILQLSDFAGDLRPDGTLWALMEFEVSGNELLMDDNNTSPYSIAPLCFNSDATFRVSGFSGISSFASPIPGAGSSQNQNLSGIRDYNGLIGFGPGINRLSLGATQRMDVLTGIGEQQTIGNRLSTLPPAQLQAIGARKLEARLNDEIAFGAAVTRLPEAARILLFGVGLVFFARFARKERNRYLQYSRRRQWLTKSQNPGPRASKPAGGGDGYSKKFVIAPQSR